MAGAFASAAEAMTAVIADPRTVRPRERVEIRCKAPAAEMLFVDWLNALVFEMATRHMLFSRFDVECDETGLQAVAYGEPVDRERHQPTVEVKGATMTALDVHRDADGAWVAQCVVDV